METKNSVIERIDKKLENKGDAGMGLSKHGGTMPGALTPICNACGSFLCWDIGEDEADENRDFWDAWVCQDCNDGERMSLKQWRSQRAGIRSANMED